jgi:hypothetical protein
LENVMLETAVALLAAHVLADFLLQFGWILRNKRRIGFFALHVAIVLATILLVLGIDPREHWGLLALITLSHAGLDAVKTFAFDRDWVRARPRVDFALFSADQLGHVAFIALAAWIWPTAFAGGAWAQALGPAAGDYAVLLAAVTGFVIATRTGEFLIMIFMSRFELPAGDDPGLESGGAWIGLLERALVFAFVLAGQVTAIGFLIAAKSVLRFRYASERSISEYVIIGTLASFGWAIGVALLTDAVVHRLVQ